MKKIINRIFAFLLSLLLVLLSGCKSNEDAQPRQHSYDLKIGILFHGVNMFMETDALSEAIYQYAKDIEQNFNVKFEFATFKTNTDTLSMANDLLQSGVDVILNASTDVMPALVQLCEQNGVYIMQILDSQDDGDVLNQYVNSPYYLGCIKPNEKKASAALAQKMLNENCKSFCVFSTKHTQRWSTVHKIRSQTLASLLSKENQDGFCRVFSVDSVEGSIKSIVRSNYEIDGLITTFSGFPYSLKELKSMFHEEIKIAYFDLTPDTREDFLAGNLVAVSCGQHNIIGLAFAYVYHFLTNETLTAGREPIDLECDYLILDTTNDYDAFMKHCIYEMPYSADTLKRIIDSLDSGTETFQRYCENYTLGAIKSEKEVRD